MGPMGAPMGPMGPMGPKGPYGTGRLGLVDLVSGSSGTASMQITIQICNIPLGIAGRTSSSRPVQCHPRIKVITP